MDKKKLLFLLTGTIFFCSLSACSSTSGIDDYYTFNIVKSEPIAVPPQVPVGQDISGPFQVKIDSSDLVTSPTLQTSLALTKSVKLTKLTFSTNDAAYPMTSFDTVTLVISADSLADQVVATYSGAADMVYLTNADIAEHLKKPSSHFTITSRANKAPAQTVTITADYTFVFTAKPQQ